MTSSSDYQTRWSANASSTFGGETEAPKILVMADRRQGDLGFDTCSYELTLCSPGWWTTCPRTCHGYRPIGADRPLGRLPTDAAGQAWWAAR